MSSYMQLFKYNLGPLDQLKQEPFTIKLDNLMLVITDVIGNNKKTHINQILLRCLIDVIDNNNYYYRLFSVKSLLWIKIYISHEFLEQSVGRSCPMALMSLALYCGKNYFSAYSIAGMPLMVLTENNIPVQDITVTSDQKFLSHVKLTPYRHQISNVNWMLNIENLIIHDRFLLECPIRSNLLMMNINNGPVYIDPNTYAFYTEDGLWNRKRFQLMLKGGILADEVGLGKTLSIVLLVIATKKAKPMIKISVTPKIKIKSQECLPDKPSCRPIIGNTIIICPRRLVGQWIQEVTKYTNYLTVLEVSSITHVNKYSLQNIAAADIVIVPATMFNNSSYIESSKQLSQIEWTRLVVDEGHEFMASEGKKKAESTRVDSGIFNLNSKFRWACTGTPFPHGRSSLNGIISYLSGNNHNYISPYLSNVSEHMTFLNLVCRRNTHQSTKDQHTIPTYQEHIIWVDFTKTERAIYDNTPQTDLRQLRQLCTNINVSNLHTGAILDLNQINKVLIKQYQEDIATLQQDIIDTQLKITNLKKLETTDLADIIDYIKTLEAHDDTNAEELTEQREARNKLQTSIKNRTKTAEERLLNNKAKIKSLQEKMELFQNLDRHNAAQRECPILGTKLTDKLVITSEGQYYSYEGINLLFIGRDVIKCPVTKTSITKNSYHIIDPQSQSDVEENVSLDRIKWGSKLAKVMETLKQVLADSTDNRVIIFSQWNMVLQLLTQYLQCNNINYVTSQGHTHQITCSINKFKTDRHTKVLLLSSESANSGTNITEANYIFLVDVVDGTPEEAKAVEAQAIGRAVRLGQTKTVQVLRFVVRNTVESPDK